MSFLVIQGIPLSSSTRSAFRLLGGTICRMDRTNEDLYDMMNTYPFTVNMGRSGFNPPDFDGEFHASPLWNQGSTIQDLIIPGRARELLGNLLPPRPEDYPILAWLKAPGRGGRGKKRVLLQDPKEVPEAWDIQIHIKGTHYRINTVGHKVVQSHVKVDLPTQDTVRIGQRTYLWKLMKDVPKIVKKAAREGAKKLADERTLIGWDIVLDPETDIPYILEGNSAPGMNAATAKRTIDQITLDVLQSGEEENAN